MLLLQVGLLLNIMDALRNNKDIGYVVATSSLYFVLACWLCVKAQSNIMRVIQCSSKSMLKV